MSPEELFSKYQHLAERTLFRLYNNPYGIAKQHKIEFEDLLQYSYTGLWKAALNFDPSKKIKFTTFAINHIRWHLSERLNRETSMIKLESNKQYQPNELYGIVYMDAPLDDLGTYHEVIPSEYNIKEHIENELFIKENLNRFTGFERKIVELRLKEYTFEQIGKMYNMTKEGVRSHMRKIKIKFNNLRRVELV